MATQPLTRRTLEQYLSLEETLEFRSEFHDGDVLPVEAATPTHSSLCAAMVGILREAFFPRCAVYDASLNLLIASANRVVHPDTTVLCGEAHMPQPGCLENPTLLVEVTSPSTKDYDFGTKREMYFSLPSVHHYLLVSQTEQLVSHYQRSGEAWLYVDRGRDAIISLALDLGIKIPVAQIYAGILP